jgi:hypothetical protein
MSRSQFHSINSLILTHAWLNLWDERMTTGRINQVTIRLAQRPADRPKSLNWPKHRINPKGCAFAQSRVFSFHRTVFSRLFYRCTVILLVRLAGAFAHCPTFKYTFSRGPLGCAFLGHHRPQCNPKQLEFGSTTIAHVLQTASSIKN